MRRILADSNLQQQKPWCSPRALPRDFKCQVPNHNWGQLSYYYGVATSTFCVLFPERHDEIASVGIRNPPISYL
jgi:hypothetical protein